MQRLLPSCLDQADTVYTENNHVTIWFSLSGNVRQDSKDSGLEINSNKKNNNKIIG